jgi:Flp pilus assembly protein TadG
MVTLRNLWRDEGAASAAEFGLIVPILTLLLFSVIDAGRFMWEYNRAEKATQAGARMAVVTTVVAGGLVTPSYVGQTYSGVTLTQGDRIPASALGTVSCTSTACTCTGTCPTGVPGTANTTSFNAIVQRMQYMSPSIKATNVVIEYRGSGLGFAGDPDTTRPQISPLVTVKLTGMTFRPLAFLTFAAFTMPDFATTLTAEDLSGTASN